MTFGRTGVELLFIAGIPAAGKTYFGNWLESERGFLHIDAEKDDRLDTLSIHDTWDRCCSSGNCVLFADALRRLGRPVVFNWGSPVPCLPVAAALKAAGFVSWWLDADLTQARAEFERLGKSLSDFDNQVTAIGAASAEIDAVFAPNVVTTLNAVGVRLSPEEILALVTNPH